MTTTTATTTIHAEHQKHTVIMTRKRGSRDALQLEGDTALGFDDPDFVYDTDILAIERHLPAFWP